MKMILSNLIGNAIKYNKKDGSVFITTLRDGDKLVIAIEDTGLGIDTADIPHIFDRFYRSKSVDGHIDGTGIGLYIVKTLANAMEGEIKVESALGKGSRFTITFNAQESDTSSKAGGLKTVNRSKRLKIMSHINVAFAIQICLVDQLLDPLLPAFGYIHG